MAAMMDEQRLTLLKSNLDRPGYPDTNYLLHLLHQAEAMCNTEGVDTSDKEDIRVNNLIIDYAAYLFRKRGGEETGMPRFLTMERNNLLFAQKMAGGGSGDI